MAVSKRRRNGAEKEMVTGLRHRTLPCGGEVLAEGVGEGEG